MIEIRKRDDLHRIKSHNYTDLIDVLWCNLSLRKILAWRHLPKCWHCPLGQSSSYMRFSVRLAEKYKKKKSIYYQDLSFTQKEDNIYLEPREVFVASCNIMNHYNSRINGEGLISAVLKNAGKIEKKTLLLDKNYLHEDMTKTKIASLYPYPFEIVGTAEIEKALTDRNEKYAFVELIPVGTATNMMMHEIYDCKDGYLLSSGELKMVPLIGTAT